VSNTIPITYLSVCLQLRQSVLSMDIFKVAVRVTSIDA